MAVTLVGEIVNSCDAITGFNQGNISGDDDFVEGSGAIGLKCSAATCDMFTTTLGATAPYDFSSGGTEFGWHTIMWFNTKTPVNATTGLGIFVGDGTNQGVWDVVPFGFYKGGFITAVVNTARNFDAIVAGSWTVGGNPAQLTAVSQMGGRFVATTSIMGNFNNIQLDQMTIGLGVRADGGTVSVPNTFEIVRAADEDTNFWGWWGSAQGAVVGKGKLFIGPATGTATSVFTDTAFSVIFANERVAAGFYEINTRGAGTDVTWDLANFSVADSASARWSLTVQSDTNSFSDTNGVWSGADQLVLASSATLTGTTLVNCNKLFQNSATLDSISVLSANTADGVAFIEANNPAAISGCAFEFSDGHAIEITSPGTYTFSGNTFVGYGADDSNDAAIYNNSGGLVTLNIAGGGSTPTVRNGTNASTTINNNISVTLTNLVNPTEVRVYATGTTTELDGQEDVTTGSFVFSLSAGTFVDIRIFATSYEPADLINFEIPTSDTSIPISQRFDRNYVNP